MSNSSPRGVLLVIADDWSPIANCYGNSVIQTPNIDALAKRGTVFDHAFCTTPSCAASRASLLSGRQSHQHWQYGHCHGSHHFTTRGDIDTVPAVLAKAGVKSALMGKSHIAPFSAYPFDLIEEFDMRSRTSIAQEATKWLGSIGDAPFYLQCASLYPHRGGPQGFLCDKHFDEFDDVEYDPADVVVPDFLPDNDATRGELAAYYKSISRYDAFVGACVKAIEDAGRAEDTLILVLSDHGMPFPGAKASSYDGGHNCPLIVIDPRQDHGGTHCDALVNWLDLAPTVYDWLHAEDHAPDDLTGRSILPVLGKDATEGWDATFLSHSFHEVRNINPYRILRERRFKLVKHLAAGMPQVLPSDIYRSKTWQSVLTDGLDMMGKRPTSQVTLPPYEALYDLEADPMETTNLIDAPEHAARVDAMRERLMDYRVQTGDTFLEIDIQRGDKYAPTRAQG